MTKREAAIVTAFTGICTGDFGEAHKYIEEIMGRPIWTHEPPKVAGWYWMRQQGESLDIMQHYSQSDIDHGFDNERRLKQWAGPIPAPLEPEAS